MTKADNDSSRRQWHARLGGRLQRGRTRAGGNKRKRQRDGDDGCGSGRWQRQTTMVAVGDDGDSGRQQRRTTKAADDDGMQDRAADY